MGRAISTSGKCAAIFWATALIWFCLEAASLAATAVLPPPQGPHIYVQESRPLTVNHVGSSADVEALMSRQARPLSSNLADVDEDGVADLLVGYSTPGGGAIVVHRGNLDALAPQSRSSFLAVARGEYPSPFLPSAEV